MTNAQRVKKLYDRLNIITFRPFNEEKEQIRRIVEKEGLWEASITEIMRAFFRDNNGFEEKEKLECPYATMRSHDEIDCARDFDQKNRIHKVTRDFCNQCWERQLRNKVTQRTAEVQAMKANIHRGQQSINQTIQQERESIIICPNTDQVISKNQCNGCSLDQQNRCQTLMETNNFYKKELAKVRESLG